MTAVSVDLDTIRDEIVAAVRDFSDLAGAPQSLQLTIETDNNMVVLGMPHPGHPLFEAQTPEIRSVQVMLWLAAMRLVLLAKADSDARARAKAN